MRRTFATALSSLPGIWQFASSVTQDRLRVIAFHGVNSKTEFASQLDFLQSRWTFVTVNELAEHLALGAPLPKDALWLTFDDADPTVFRDALPVLLDRQVPSTLFVCPGLLETSLAPWWVVVDKALTNGWKIPFGLSRSDLKKIRDTDRRDLVAAAIAFLGDDTPNWSSVSDLNDWITAGMTVGNHTWDHPCLNMCGPSEQTDQILRAHVWLREHLPEWNPIFAYPNGDWTLESECFLESLGYQLICLFDHRINRRPIDARKISRLRLSAGEDCRRTRAVVSGVHSTVSGIQRRRY